MAFQIDMSPLERSSFNVGTALADAGRGIAQIKKDIDQKEESDQIESMMQNALSGDVDSLKMLMAKSPQAAQMAAQYIQRQQSAIASQQDQQKQQMSLDTADLVERIHLAPEGQQESMFNAAIEDPRYDIDEEDRQYFMNEGARKALIGSVKGNDYAERFFDRSLDDKGTANVKDFNYYQELKTEDPEAAEQFALLSGITKKTESEIKPTTAIQNFNKWSEMKEGDAKNAFGRVIGISPKETVKSARAKIERVEAKKQEIESANLMKERVDEFMANDDFIGSVTGATSRLPAVFEGSVDAEAAFDSLKDSLTMENLNKMSGVLTDKDIQLLANAASALRYGMSEKQLKIEMNKIKRSMDRNIKKALEGVPIESINTEAFEGNSQLSDSAKKYLGN